MTPRLYKLLLTFAALNWVGFGMALSAVLRAVDAGEPLQPQNVITAVWWALIGVGNLWFLFHLGRPAAERPSDASAHAA